MDLPTASKKAVQIVQAKATESFQNKSQEKAATMYLVFLFFMILFMIVSAFGASVLSWNYNAFLGTSKGLAVFYAILAFFFSEFYYPAYAFFFNPLTSAGTLIAPNIRAANNALNKRNNRSNNNGAF